MVVHEDNKLVSFAICGN